MDVSIEDCCEVTVRKFEFEPEKVTNANMAGYSIIFEVKCDHGPMSDLSHFRCYVPLSESKNKTSYEIASLGWTSIRQDVEAWKEKVIYNSNVQSLVGSVFIIPPNH